MPIFDPESTLLGPANRGNETPARERAHRDGLRARCYAPGRDGHNLHRW